MKQAILAQLTVTKYYFIIVYATPDSSHVEQTSFILRYGLLTKFKSAFLNLLIVTKKTGKSIAELINETLRKNSIHVPLADCRGQALQISNGKPKFGLPFGVWTTQCKPN